MKHDGVFISQELFQKHWGRVARAPWVTLSEPGMGEAVTPTCGAREATKLGGHRRPVRRHQ